MIDTDRYYVMVRDGECRSTMMRWADADAIRYEEETMFDVVVGINYYHRSL